MLKNILRKILIIITLIYIGLLVTLFFSQKSLLYFPSSINFYTCDWVKFGEKKVYKDTSFYEFEGTTGGLIVYFHGNAGRVCDREKIASILQETGLGVILVEYSGYTGNVSEEPDIDDILKNVEDISEYLNVFNYWPIYSGGRSIGTGPASYFTTKTEVKKLLLISPYNQLYQVGADKYKMFPVKYLFTQNFNSEKYLEDYSGEVLILHGNQDRVISQKFGIKLFENIGKSSKKEFINIEGGSHNNELYITGVEEKIREYLK